MKSIGEIVQVVGHKDFTNALLVGEGAPQHFTSDSLPVLEMATHMGERVCKPTGKPLGGFSYAFACLGIKGVPIFDRQRQDRLLKVDRD